jgi:serine/threonine protein kinase
MSLQPSTRLGPYEIISSIGAGGMGEVYRARDTRLDRIVAIKVLPEHLSSNPQLRERFEREAKAISSLSHPHICPLYDVGHQDGIDYLVMEYLEGETLQRHLANQVMSVEQLLESAERIFEYEKALFDFVESGIVTLQEGRSLNRLCVSVASRFRGSLVKRGLIS